MKSGTQGLERETSAPALDEGIEESCSKFANFLFSLVSRIFANRCERCRQAGRDSGGFCSFKYFNKISHSDIHWHSFASSRDNIKTPFRKFLRHKICRSILLTSQICILQNLDSSANSVQFGDV